MSRSVVGYCWVVAVSLACFGCRQVQPAPAATAAPAPTIVADAAPPVPVPPRRGVVDIKPPADRVVVFAARADGWNVADTVEHIDRTTGISVLRDTEYPESSSWTTIRTIDAAREFEIRESELIQWLQGIVSPSKLVSVGPKRPGDGKRYWVIHTGRCCPPYVAMDAVEQYADRPALFVVTKLTLTRVRDTTAVRSALSPLSTAEGVGRLVEIPGECALIVGDYAPVVVSMKRIVDLLNWEPVAK